MGASFGVEEELWVVSIIPCAKNRDARGEGVGDLFNRSGFMLRAEGVADEEDGVVGGDEVGEAGG